MSLRDRDELSDAVAKTTIREPQPALAGATCEAAA
jgi:hypothetical protein